MPCRNDDCGPSYYTDPAVKAELDKVTRLLCEVITRDPKVVAGHVELEAWWKAHQKADKERREREERAALERQINRMKEIEGLKLRIKRLEKERDEEEE